VRDEPIPSGQEQGIDLEEFEDQSVQGFAGCATDWRRDLSFH